MATLTMEVPDDFLGQARFAVERAIRECQWAAEREARIDAVLECDDAFFEEFRWNPIVRASVYEGQKIGSDREFRDYSHKGDRRPVAMRAAAAILADRAWYANKLLRRYVRRIKLTCVKRQEIIDRLCPIEYRVEEKIRTLARRRKRIHFEWRIYFNSERECCAWVDGEFYHSLSSEQFFALEQTSKLLGRE